jgi:hypothetical protein
VTAVQAAGAPRRIAVISGVALVVVARLAATLPAAISTSSLVARSASAFPLGELALFEHGGELLAEVLRRNRPNPTVLLIAVLAHALLLLVPDGSLVALVTGAARSTGAALVGSAKRLGFLFAAFAFSLVGRALAVMVVFFFWQRFSGAGTVLLILIGVAIGLGTESFAINAKLDAIRGQRARAALASAFTWRRTLATMPLTALHVVVQLLLAVALLAVGAGGMVQRFFVGHGLVGLLLVVASVLARAALYRVLARRSGASPDVREENDETACRVPSN